MCICVLLSEFSADVSLYATVPQSPNRVLQGTFSGAATTVQRNPPCPCFKHNMAENTVLYTTVVLLCDVKRFVPLC